MSKKADKSDLMIFVQLRSQIPKDFVRYAVAAPGKGKEADRRRAYISAAVADGLLPAYKVRKVNMNRAGEVLGHQDSVPYVNLHAALAYLEKLDKKNTAGSDDTQTAPVQTELKLDTAVVTEPTAATCPTNEEKVITFNHVSAIFAELCNIDDHTRRSAAAQEQLVSLLTAAVEILTRMEARMDASWAFTATQAPSQGVSVTEDTCGS